MEELGIFGKYNREYIASEKLQELRTLYITSTFEGSFIDFVGESKLAYLEKELSGG